MRFFRILFLLLIPCILVSCAGGSDREPPASPKIFRLHDPAAAMERISTALRSGNVLIRDTRGYNRVFGADTFRLRDTNIRLTELTFIPETEDFTCGGLVMDSGTEDGRYDIVFFAGSMNPAVPPALIRTETVFPEKKSPPPILPEPSALATVCEAMRKRIQSGELFWDTDLSVSLRKNPPEHTGKMPKKNNTAQPVEHTSDMFYYLETEWWKDRLLATKGTLRLTEADLALCRVAAGPGGTVRLTYCVMPLIVRTSGRTLSYATWEAELDHSGALLQTRKGGENSFEDALSVILYPFSREENDEIYRTVFHYLFEQSAAKVNGAAPPEKVRFLFIPETADPDFLAKYTWHSALPIRSPYRRDWSLGIPFNEKAGRYTGFGNGEYYYAAGAIRPVDNTSVYVMASIFCLPPTELSPEETAKYKAAPILENATVQFNGPVGYLKLKKGIFGWYVERDFISQLAPPEKKQTETTETTETKS